MDKLGLNLPGLIAQFVNFGILLFILWKFVLPPVQRMLDERRQRIQESLEAADRMRAQAIDAERQVQAQLEEARQQSRQLVAEAQAVAKRIEEEARARGQAEVELIRARALADIQLERDAAIAALRREFADITVAAAEKVINRALDRTAHRQLIEEVLSEAGYGDGART